MSNLLSLVTNVPFLWFLSWSIELLYKICTTDLIQNDQKNVKKMRQRLNKLVKQTLGDAHSEYDATQVANDFQQLWLIVTSRKPLRGLHCRFWLRLITVLMSHDDSNL